ncbi:MAG: substrate-binding domain-containing protein, partial [Telluria sp.]
IAALGPKQSCVVMLNHRSDSMPGMCFSPDHAQGGALAARTLLDRGHRKIAVIAGPSTSPDSVERINGFLGELARAGVDTSGMWIAESDFSPEGGFASAAELVATGQDFTALFCANDEMAVGALSYFQQAGIKVPAQGSVLGYDDTPSAEFSAPQLTTVHIPWRDVTLSGVNALLNRCYGGERPVSCEFPISLTERASLADASTLPEAAPPHLLAAAGGIAAHA